MKIVTTFLAMLLTIQSTLSFAHTDRNKEIAYALDKIRYQAEVGIIADGQSARASAVEALEGLKQAGISDQEIIDSIKNRIVDAQLKSDFQNLLNAMKVQNLSEAEIMNKLSAFVQAASHQGSNFRGTVIFIGVGTTLGLIATFYLVAILYALSKAPH